MESVTGENDLRSLDPLRRPTLGTGRAFRRLRDGWGGGTSGVAPVAVAMTVVVAAVAAGVVALLVVGLQDPAEKL